MRMMERAPSKLDVLDTLKTVIRAWWIEFAPITLLGFLLLMLPSLALTAAFGPGVRSGGVDSLGTMAQTLLGVLNLLYFCAVAFGVLAGLGGRRLDAKTFMAAGLRAARPGLQAALVLAIGLVIAANFLVASRIFGGAALIIAAGAIGAVAWGFSALLPAVPAAIAERRRPIDALRRALLLTAGHRWRLFGLGLIVLLALMPPVGVFNLVMFGPNASPERASKVLASLSFGDPRMWIAQLWNVLLCGILACLPPVIYVQLVRLKGGGGRPSPA